MRFCFQTYSTIFVCTVFSLLFIFTSESKMITFTDITQGITNSYRVKFITEQAYRGPGDKMMVRCE